MEYERSIGWSISWLVEFEIEMQTILVWIVVLACDDSHSIIPILQDSELHLYEYSNRYQQWCEDSQLLGMGTYADMVELESEESQD